MSINLTGECWDVQWLSKDGEWMPHKPYMSRKDAQALFDECIRLRPSSEQFRLVRVSTLVDVFDEGNGLG